MSWPSIRATVILWTSVSFLGSVSEYSDQKSLPEYGSTARDRTLKKAKKKKQTKTQVFD